MMVCEYPKSELKIVIFLHRILIIAYPFEIETAKLDCIVKRVSWFKSSLLLRIQNKHTNKY
jgi:hypothetical protein